MNLDKQLLFQTSAALAFCVAISTPAFAQTQTATQSQAQTPPTEETSTQAPAQGSEQQAPPAAAPEEDPYAEGGEIVVTGVRRGSVIGDIPPENQLGPRDIRATGATDLLELLDALAPQIGSARGRGGEAPVLLLNGKRISGFREIRDIPPEAIERLDILPEEVALKYGYRADQRVVNIVLRERFHSTATRLDGTVPTEGGNFGGVADVTRLAINKAGRTTTNIHAEGNTSLKESERDIELEDPNGPDDRSARTLVGSKKLIRGTETINRTVLGDASGTLNAEVQYNEGRSLFGLSDVALEPLVRNISNATGHLGFSLNGDKGKWHLSATGNGDVGRAVTYSDRLDEGDPRNRAESVSTSADINLMANGPLVSLPAGDANITVNAGGSTLHLDNENRIQGISASNDLGRTQGNLAANVDLPISRRNRDFSALGNLTLNANAEVDQLSDFGTLTVLGAGANWSPVDRLNFLVSWTREEGPPTIQQLGDPIIFTPDTRVFDFTTGETVEVTAISGGNPDLLADKRNVLKFGGNWKPWEKTDLRLRAEYVHQTIDNVVASFPGITAELEAAFPDRFIRDASGQLVSVDFRPVNYDESRRDTIRLGFDFSKPLKSARPSQAAIDRFRAQRAAAGGRTQGVAPPPPPEGGPLGGPGPESGPPPGGGPAGGGFGPGGGGGGGGFGRFGGGRQGGRLQFSVTDTITLVDEVTIRPGLPKLDYLHGDALGSTGGRPRHQVETQAGYFNNGLGARLSANWRGGTHVDSLTGSDLDFSPLATFDVRLFANLGERFDLVSKHPWLRGSSVRFEVTNLFNSRPRVRDQAGQVPNNYQADLLDPLGRTISISIRKLFLPPPGFFRRQNADQQRPQG
ncbi:TonB-dependent receptor [Sphingomonas sp. SM33]|uniref:TonB-dependent receptor n=1 Tax=Sphingomonas telluris TaxID=2907998 RepID=A0ABS9VL06_9SPHN|nr:TonB-dependent receptor [Sphingomonas telluris]MCH8615107.1 TonB-dependent receptor [Sphingomonas telluris]